MDRIELSPFDKKDLLELLDYAKMKKKEDSENRHFRDKWNDYKYWEMRINQLSMIVKGYVPTPSVQSSFCTIDTEMNKQDKAKMKYRQKLENDLIDLIDYIDEKKGEDSLY